MRIALLADIHGNDLALRAVLEDAKKNGATELFVAGDLSGYYYGLDAVIALLDLWPWEGVQGNHDAWLVKILDGDKEILSWYSRKYGSSFEAAMHDLNDGHRDSFVSLAPSRVIERAGKKILLCHGSPWSQDEYVYPDAPTELFDRIAALGHDAVIMGHTHYPMVKRIGSTVIINPGSAGQPRDIGNSASWAIFDPESGDVEPHRTIFDPAPLLAEIERRDPQHPYLRDVLLRNKNIT